MEWDETDLVWIYDTVSVDDLATYIGTDSDDPALAGVLAAATAYLHTFTDQCLSTRPVPSAIYKMVVLETAGEWYKRKDRGAQQYAGFEGVVAVRAPNDPLAPVFNIIKRYLPVGFGA